MSSARGELTIPHLVLSGLHTHHKVLNYVCQAAMQDGLESRVYRPQLIENDNHVRGALVRILPTSQSVINLPSPLSSLGKPLKVLSYKQKFQMPGSCEQWTLRSAPLTWA